MTRCTSMLLVVSSVGIVSAFRAQPSIHRIIESRTASLGLLPIAAKGKERGHDFALSFLRTDVDAEKCAEMVDIDAELAFIARRNVLLAGEIATIDAALWRWVHEEEEEGDVSTDEGFIESIANMLLQRPPVGLPTTPSTCIEQKYM